MSIVIHGMDMPESCNKCKLGDGVSCYITGLIVGEGDTTRRASSCPVGPYPELTAWDVTCDPEYRESHFEKDEWGD